MSDIIVRRKADGMVMSVNSGVVSAFLSNGWEPYVEPVVVVTKAEKPKNAVSEPVEEAAEQAPAEAKKTSTRGRKKAVRG